MSRKAELYEKNCMKKALQRRRHYRFYRMHAVFRLVEDNRLRTVKDVVGNFHTVEPEFFVYLFPRFCFKVVERGETVHKFAVSSCVRK